MAFDSVLKKMAKYYLLKKFIILIFFIYCYFFVFYPVGRLYIWFDMFKIYLVAFVIQQLNLIKIISFPLIDVSKSSCYLERNDSKMSSITSFVSSYVTLCYHPSNALLTTLHWYLWMNLVAIVDWIFHVPDLWRSVTISFNFYNIFYMRCDIFMWWTYGLYCFRNNIAFRWFSYFKTETW